ncbi:multidrug resistance-associated ABC transporter [Mycena maculata]|uniref:Multidrug resistance-associated ABC transporter n=1 Tax=Mycena maculata TaxID=230809 RepID=A0AAD7I8H6_9AGAR|nr:multidrug resistance-associated ABC transporter [Mycena maculata]
MAGYQLQIAIALGALAVSSALLFFLNRTSEGKIHLPAEEDIHPGDDPLDVTSAEDLLDGYPIDEATFWAHMFMRKLFVCVLLGLLVIVETACFFLGGDSIISALHTCFSLYLLIVAVFAVRRSTVKKHAESVWHLTSLMFFAVVLLGFTTMIPTDESPAIDKPTIFLWYLRSAVLPLYAVTFLTILTTPRGPLLHYPPSAIYSEKTAQAITNTDKNNVAGVYGASPWSFLFFSYSTKVVMLGNTATSLEIGDLPILTANMRATFHYTGMRRAMQTWKLSFRNWHPRAGSGASLAYQLACVNRVALSGLILLSVTAGLAFYLPPYFMSRVLVYLESDPHRTSARWGYVWVVCLFSSNFALFTLTAQLWSLATTIFQARIRTQLNTILFAKTLVRKDIASSAAASAPDDAADGEATPSSETSEFSSKAQIMTLMTTDVDRVGEFSDQLFTIVDTPIELAIGAFFLYNLLGISAFFGLGVAVLSLPINNYAGKLVAAAQENLMEARDERVALMNEVLGGIRMLKFMAWERSFEARIMAIRVRELKFQRQNYTIESLLAGLWNATPVLVTLVSFYHFAVVREETLSPSIAFTSIIVFNELKYALSALPETFIDILQSIVSLRRIEKYLNTPEVTPVPTMTQQSQTIAFQSCTVTWPQASGTTSTSATSTPRHKFVLVDLSLNFPLGGLSLICGKLGSGKTLLLLALLGEADVLSGQLMCPRSPANSLASFAAVHPPKEDWVVQGICAYVPQAVWLRNASIKDNILFNLPYDEMRYRLTLETCALMSDLEILEDGDDSEIGEHGINLSGGQKARVSLARAVYSRASLLLLDDVLSAVDAHTAHHIYHKCLKGELMRGRTVVLVSHHVQLCAPGAGYVVALDNGRVQFQGTPEHFKSSGAMASLVLSTNAELEDEKEEAAIADSGALTADADHNTADSGSDPTPTEVKKVPRKFFEDEKRAVGRVALDVWKLYITACGSGWYWVLFFFIFILAGLAPLLENGWLGYWSRGEGSNSPMFYLGIYTAVACAGLITTTLRFFVLYHGSISASTVLYKKLLETVLFAQIRFHDTVSRGRLLNRFGKDFEEIDSSLAEDFGTTTIHFISTITTIITISFVGGPIFIVATFVVAVIYYRVAKTYGQASRDMRRIDSVTRSPLYSMYSETISGVAVLRSFGASSKFLRDMFRHVDTNMNPGYWTWGVSRWFTIRMTCLSSIIMALIALLAVLNDKISAPLAGFALAFANTLTYDLNLVLREFVSLEQAMVGLERIKEYSDLDQEAAEFIEPRPPSSWPQHGAIQCENLVIRYAPDLPDVLHNLTFTVNPGEKIGILGRTGIRRTAHISPENILMFLGSGKSTLALSFFRFVEATEGRIVVDGLDIANIGLADLRNKLTIIPQDPTILSGTLRSTLDVFNEYQGADIFEALRRVHLIPAEGTAEEELATVNANIFRNLDSPISEGGDNLSTGEKQLLCMARAILKRSRVLVMDEVHFICSVDYATDELIGKTIRHEFKESTILTIAHRLRTVIDYDKILLLDQGRIAEFDRPANLLGNTKSKLYQLCKATGREEFAMLLRMAGV